MPHCLLVLALLAAPLFADAEGVALPEQTHGDMTARLTVHVADAGPQPGAALVRLTLTVTGGPLLQVETPQLADPLSAWEAQQNEWCNLRGDRLTWTKAILLRQIKPGPAALPDTKVRFREGPRAPWQGAEWIDILKVLRDAPPPAPLPTPPSGTIWLLWLVPVAALAPAALIWIFRRRQRPAQRVLPAHQRALLELRRLEQSPGLNVADYHTALSGVVRLYLAERFGLPAMRQTTAEFLEAVGRTNRLPVEEQALLRDLLERCDLAKFAPVGASADDRRDAAGMAVVFIERTAGAGLLPPPMRERVGVRVQSARESPPTPTLPRMGGGDQTPDSAPLK